VDLRGSSPAAAIDLHERRVYDQLGIPHPFDALVLATGSRPFVPPITGADRPGVLTFRTRADVAAIAASAQSARRAVVIGGGLLGLEAAAGIRACGTPVTVLEAAGHLMPQQLDAAASRMLARALDALGIRSVCGARVERIDATGVVVAGREVVGADLVVVAAGIRPETTLAAQAGLEVRRGVVVDDELRASAPDVWAVGECAEHRGTVYGLWAPIAAQARVAGAAVCGDAAGFHGSITATNLKVAGVHLFAGGEQGGDEVDALVWSDGPRGVYRRLRLDGDRLAGAILVGDTTDARELSSLLRTGEPVPDRFLAPPGARGEPPAPQLSDVVCTCNGVTRGAIESAIAANGLTSLTAVSRATRAATGCGSCAGDVERLIAEHDGVRREGSSIRNTSVTGRKPRLATIEA
jgi:ferredoxin-nitrate reductase